MSHCTWKHSQRWSFNICIFYFIETEIYCLDFTKYLCSIVFDSIFVIELLFLDGYCSMWFQYEYFNTFLDEQKSKADETCFLFLQWARDCYQFTLLSWMSLVSECNSYQRSYLQAVIYIGAWRPADTDEVRCCRKKLWDLKLQWDDTLEDYIDRRLIELQIGWSDLLTVCIISASVYELSVHSHADPHKLRRHISLDVWRLYIQRIERWGGMSESGRLAGILGTCGAYWSLNLSLSLEDLENFSIVHALPTFCLLSQELLCDWAWLDGGKCVHVRATGNTKISVCAEGSVHFSHPILLICCAVISAIPLPVCLSPPHVHIPAYTCQTLT